MIAGLEWHAMTSDGWRSQANNSYNSINDWDMRPTRSVKFAVT